MEKEIRVRKQRFWAFLLVLVCSSVVSTNTEAASHTNSEGSISVGQILAEGEEITVGTDMLTCTIEYLDGDGETSLGGEKITSDNPHKVQEYTGSELDPGKFFGWIVKTIMVSDDNSTVIILEPAGTYPIVYNLDGGEHAGDNPDEYTVGEGVKEFAEAAKAGYTFAGWYEDDGYGTKIESIAEDRSGKIMLYAKFTPNICNIIYDLDGGKNDANNPDTYTVGVGVASLAPATKDGYTFAGWYRHAGSSVMIDTIGPEEVNDIRLYAVFISSETSSDDTAMAPDTEEDMSGTLEDAAVNLILESGVFHAEAGIGYCLGSGTWRVSGDSTSYSGGIIFYVPTDGEYEVTLE